MINLRNFDALTFDCYGTLIDWESGILGVLVPWRDRHGLSLADDDLLRQYAEVESALERGPYLRYREVLQNVMSRLAEMNGVALEERERDALAESLERWPPFPDTIEALKVLKQHYQLAIISNVDRDLFTHSARRLGVPFDFVITSEDVGSYKPSHRNFEYALERIGMPKERVLHVAQSLFHDHVPCNELGISSAWVNRRRGKTGPGATRPADARPDLEVPDLVSFARLVEEAQ